MDFGVVIGISGIAVGLAGVAYGMWWTKHQSRQSARSTLHIAIVHHFELRPSAYQPDLSNVLTMSWSGTPIGNIVCLGLTLRLEGYNDHEDPSARTPPAPGAPSRPRIDFDNLRVLSISTVNNDPNLFEVPIAKANGDKSVYLNVIRLKANATARFTIVATKLDEKLPISASLTQGYIKQVDLRAADLLRAP